MGNFWKSTIMHGLMGALGGLLCLVFYLLWTTPQTPIGHTFTNQSIVKLVRLEGHGSGVYIGDGNYLTANHVIDGLASVDIVTTGGETRKANIVWASKDYDIAMVHADSPDTKPAKLNCGVIPVGSEIHAQGNPMMLDFVTTYGHIAKLPETLDHWKSTYIVDMVTVQGMSGGPVLDSNDDIVGITVGVLYMPLGISSSMTGIGAVVPSSEICKMLGIAK